MGKWFAGDNPIQKIPGSKKGGITGKPMVVRNPKAMASMIDITTPCQPAKKRSKLVQFSSQFSVKQNLRNAHFSCITGLKKNTHLTFIRILISGHPWYLFRAIIFDIQTSYIIIISSGKSNNIKIFANLKKKIN